MLLSVYRYVYIINLSVISQPLLQLLPCHILLKRVTT